MNCKKVVLAISDYLDGDLRNPEREELELHVSECDSCTTEVDSMRDMLASLRSLGGRECPVDCWPEIRGRICAAKPKGQMWRQWLLRPVVAAPTFAVATILAVFLLLPIGGGQPAASNSVSVGEYSQYISAHARAQRQQAFTDPDVVFVSAELERASLTTTDH